MKTSTLTKNRREIFRAYCTDSWPNLYRMIYKYTHCGPALGVMFSGMDRPVYCDGLREVSSRRRALQIHVSSIVEGVEQTTDTHVIDLTRPGASKRLDVAIEAVAKEAKEIWDATHGCPRCAKLQGLNYDEECGNIPVVPDCKSCEGYGEMI